MKIFIAFLAGFLFASSGLAQSLPPLNFDAPAGFSGGGSDEAAIFTSPERDLAIHVYPFRRLGPGEFQARFHETLLREFVAAGQREAKLAAPAKIESIPVEGADASLIGKFTEGGRERSRVAIFAAGAVAIVDVVATSAPAAERHAGAMKEMLDSLSVGQPKARAAPPPILSAPEAAAAAAVAAPAAAAPQAAAPAPLPAFLPGVYVGSVRRLIPSFVGGKESGGMWVTAPQYFLFYGGYVYRNYEAPRVPGGDPGRFDWERVRREDAANAGTYELVGGELTLRLGTETISAKLAGPGRFEIFGNYFKRTAAK